MRLVGRGMGGRVVVDHHCIVLRSNLGCNRFRMIRDDICASEHVCFALALCNTRHGLTEPCGRFTSSNRASAAGAQPGSTPHRQTSGASRITGKGWMTFLPLHLPSPYLHPSRTSHRHGTFRRKSCACSPHYASATFGASSGIKREVRVPSFSAMGHANPSVAL